MVPVGRQAEAKQTLEEAVDLHRRQARALNFLSAELQPTPVWDALLDEARALIR